MPDTIRRDLLHKPDEEIEAEGAPGVFVEVVVAERTGGSEDIRGIAFGVSVFGDEGHIERATSFAKSEKTAILAEKGCWAQKLCSLNR